MSSGVQPLLAQPDATTATTNSTANSSSSSSSNNQLTGNSFIRLLTAQLQAQDPLDPIDPTTFVTQLVQFNQLQQLIDINGELTAATPTAGTNSNATNPSTAGM